MSGYVGVEPIPQANTIINQGTIAATTSSIFVPNGYNVGNIEVFLNGLRLKASDFTATDGVYVNFAQTLNAGTDYIIQDVRNYQQADVDAGFSSQHLQIRQMVKRVATLLGYSLVDGSFESGGTVTNTTDVLWCESDGISYAWGGTLPYSVAVSTSPSSTGGIGPTTWIARV